MSSDITFLLKQLNAPEAAVRGEAARQLASLGPDAREAAVHLTRLSADSDEGVREWAVASLEELGPPSPRDISPLAELLTSEHEDVGYWAATLLGRLGPEASEAVGALESALQRPADTSLCQRAAWALGQIGPAANSAVEALQKAAASDNPRLSRLAERALEQIGPI
jgi:HEAT repeat protein